MNTDNQVPGERSKLVDASDLSAVAQGAAILARADGVTQPGVGHIQDALQVLAGAEQSRTGSASPLRLNLGPQDSARGIFGAGTERAILEFQRQVGLPPTGQVDADVLATLDRQLRRASEEPMRSSQVSAATPISHPRFASFVEFGNVLAGNSMLKIGDIGPAVIALQLALGDMGFPMRVLKDGAGVSGADGAFGSQTQTALRNFQVHARHRFNRVRPTGFSDAATLTAIIGLAPSPEKKAWHNGEPQHAPVPCWNGSQRLRVVVVKDEHRTFLYDSAGRCVGIFPNAHGTAGSETDTGLKKIRTKLNEPDAKAVGRDLWKSEKAFGKRILDLSWASGKSHGEELHGTYDYKNMGKDVSHGCMRHYNEDIITIFDAVNVGDYVAIVSSWDEPLLRA